MQGYVFPDDDACSPILHFPRFCLVQAFFLVWMQNRLQNPGDCECTPSYSAELLSSSYRVFVFATEPAFGAWQLFHFWIEFYQTIISSSHTHVVVVQSSDVYCSNAWTCAWLVLLPLEVGCVTCVPWCVRKTYENTATSHNNVLPYSVCYKACFPKWQNVKYACLFLKIAVYPPPLTTGISLNSGHLQCSSMVTSGVSTHPSIKTSQTIITA